MVDLNHFFFRQRPRLSQVQDFETASSVRQTERYLALKHSLFCSQADVVVSIPFIFSSIYGCQPQVPYMILLDLSLTHLQTISEIPDKSSHELVVRSCLCLTEQ